MWKMLPILLVLTGCGKGLGGEPGRQDIRSAAAVASFIQEAAARGRDLSASSQIDVLFVPTVGDGEKSGRCIVEFPGKRRIEISESDWAGLEDPQREELIFHELGHCILDREHKDDRDADGYLVSLMSTHMVSGVQYESRRTAYLDELFN